MKLKSDVLSSSLQLAVATVSRWTPMGTPRGPFTTWSGSWPTWTRPDPATTTGVSERSLPARPLTVTVEENPQLPPKEAVET